MAAVVATRNDAELTELFSDSGTFDLSFFSNSTASQFLRHFLLKGVLQDVEVLQKRLRRLLGDATFLQAFAHSGAPVRACCSAALWGVRQQMVLCDGDGSLCLVLWPGDVLGIQVSAVPMHASRACKLA